MTPTRAQNQVRREYGVGKGLLHRRMRKSGNGLFRFAMDALYRKVPDLATKQWAHREIDQLVADSVIAAAYREAEKEMEVEG